MSIKLGIVSDTYVSEGLILHLDPRYLSNYILSSVEVLVVAGGGGGGVCWGGGGGGGGVIYINNFPVTPGSAISLSVGGGGTNQVNVSGNGGNGQNSTFGNLTAIGGGGGGGNCGNAGLSGGSGGGGSSNGSSRTAGGSGTVGQGNNGNHSIVSGGGGGGGAGNGGLFASRKGGDGLVFNISGTPTYYGGGGSAGGYDGNDFTASRIRGGLGGGGIGGIQMPAGLGDATPNTGGGGGGSIISGGGVSGLGGSGIVIVRYPGPQKATGGTITQVNGYTVHTFTSVGNATFTPNINPSNEAGINGLEDLCNNFGSVTSYNGPTFNTGDAEAYINFDGTDDFMQGNIALGRNGTIEFAAKSPNWASNVGGQPIPIAIDGDIYGSGPNVFVYLNSINWNTGDGGSNPFSGSSTPANNVWHHFLITNDRDSNVARLYQNGVFIGTANSLDMTTTGFNKLYIGRWHGGGYLTNMRFGFLRVYNRPLTATEALQNYNSIRRRFGI